VAVRFNSRERPAKSPRYSGPKSSSPAATAIASALPCEVPGMFALKSLAAAFRLMVAGESLDAKLAMLSSVTTRRAEGWLRHVSRIHGRFSAVCTFAVD
jgi:hypothetical protein